MRKTVTLECTNCKRSYSYQFLLKCPHCDGMINPVYDLANATIHDTQSPLERYFDLVPIEDTDSIVYLGEGNTPTIHAKNIGKIFGLENLYLKNETKNITGSTKDRMATCVVSQFSELGINEFVASSTGNSSTSFAYAVQHKGGMTLHLFCGKDFVHRHAHYNHPEITLHVVDGNFVDAGKEAKKFAEENGLVFEGGFFNLARREGLKLAYLEAFDQMPKEPSVVIQAVSSGMGLYGGYRGASEYLKLGRLENMPRFVCAQQNTCSPMVSAYEANSPVIRKEDIVEDPHGIAEAILRGDPTQAYPYMHGIVTQTNGCFVSVDEDEIKEVQKLLKETEGINACYAASTALTAAKELRKRNWIKADEVVLVNLTGGMVRPEIDKIK